MILVNEIFESIQGEGSRAGRPCFFLRLQGCSVGCYFCDEKKTWRRDGGHELGTSEILNEFQRINPLLKTVTITGGEPCEQDLSELLDLLTRESYAVAIETSGTGDYTSVLCNRHPERSEGSPSVRNDIWITLSPKEIYSARAVASGNCVSSISDEIWQAASEIKFVISGAQATEYLREVILPRAAGRPVYLVPDWFDFETNKNLVLELCKQLPDKVRLGLQGHKYLGIA